MTARRVTLTKEQHAAVEALVASSEYPDIAAVLTEAVGLLEFRIELAKLRRRAFDEAIEEGERAYREGRYTTISCAADLAAFMRNLEYHKISATPSARAARASAPSSVASGSRRRSASSR